jgi:hypothetical protein
VICFFFFTRAHFVIGLWAVKLACRTVKNELTELMSFNDCVAAAKFSPVRCGDDE